MKTKLIDGVEYVETPDNGLMLKSNISTKDIMMDQITAKYYPQFKALEQQLIELNRQAALEIDDLDTLLKSEHSAGIKGKLGNGAVRTIDRKWEIKISPRTSTLIDVQIETAKQMIAEWSTDIVSKVQDEETRNAIESVFQNAFKTTKFSNNSYSLERIKQLLTLEINHPKWIEIKELIQQCLQKSPSHRSLVVKEWTDEQGYRQLFKYATRVLTNDHEQADT